MSDGNESSFQKGMSGAIGAVFGLFLIFVVAPCAFCGGLSTCAGIAGSGSESVESPASSTEPNNSEASNEPTVPPMETVSISTKVTEKNSVYWKYAWKMKLRNNTDYDESVNLKLKWIDAEGYEIQSEPQFGLSIPAQSEADYNGSVMIQLPSAENVDSIAVEVM